MYGVDPIPFDQSIDTKSKEIIVQLRKPPRNFPTTRDEFTRLPETGLSGATMSTVACGDVFDVAYELQVISSVLLKK